MADPAPPSAPPVSLRPCTAEDLPRVLALAARPEVAGGLAPDPGPGLREALDAGPAAGELLVIESVGAPVGAVRWAVRFERSRLASVRTLMVDPGARRQGVATAALRALCDRVLVTAGQHRLEAEVYGFNAPAQRTFAQAGFAREGVRRRAWPRHGEWHDGILYGRLAEEGPAA
jgi:aminoglycoside 6'-N-acetyltransferase